MKKKWIWNIARITVIVVLAVVIVRKIHLDDSYTDLAGEMHFGRITQGDDHITFENDAGKRDISLSALTYEEGKPPYEEGLKSVLAGAKFILFPVALVLYFLIPLLTIWRWQMLLRIQDVKLSFKDLFKFTYIGMFFNNAMPGMTGGDLIKTYYVAKQTHKKTEAITTVVLDRLVGMTGLIILCSVMLVFKLSDPNFRQFAVYILPAVGVGLLGAMVFFTDRIRNALGVNKLKAKLPFQKIVHEIDEAILIYKRHPRVVVVVLIMSIGVHVGMSLINFILGSAIGITAMSFSDYLVLVPILLTIMALPISLAGWGVGEMAYIKILGDVGVGAPQALALSLMQRIVPMAWSLLGGWFLMTEGKRVSTAEMADEMEPSEPVSTQEQ